MNKVKIFLLIIANIVIQSTVLSRLSLFGVHGNLSIPVVVMLAIGFGPYIGGFGGLIIGLIEDMLFSPVIGIRSLIYFVIGYLLGNSEAGINKDDIRSGLIFTLVATVVNFIAGAGINIMVGEKVAIVKYLLGPIFIEMGINALLYCGVFFLFKRLFVFPRFRL